MPVAEAPIEKKWAPAKEPGKNTPAQAFVASALLEQGTSIRKTADITGLSKSVVQELTPTKRKERGETFIDPEYVKLIRQRFKDLAAIKAYEGLGTLNQARFEKAGIGEAASAISKLADQAGLVEPSRTEHFHAVMLKFSSEPVEPTVLINNMNPDNVK